MKQKEVDKNFKRRSKPLKDDSTRNMLTDVINAIDEYHRKVFLHKVKISAGSMEEEDMFLSGLDAARDIVYDMRKTLKE